MTELNSYTRYEYAISAGEGTLIAYGQADITTIQAKTIAALLFHGTVTVVTKYAFPDCKTGEYIAPMIKQVCA